MARRVRDAILQAAMKVSAMPSDHRWTPPKKGIADTFNGTCRGPSFTGPLRNARGGSGGTDKIVSGKPLKRTPSFGKVARGEPRYQKASAHGCAAGSGDRVGGCRARRFPHVFPERSRRGGRGGRPASLRSSMTEGTADLGERSPQVSEGVRDAI